MPLTVSRMYIRERNTPVLHEVTQVRVFVGQDDVYEHIFQVSPRKTMWVKLEDVVHDVGRGEKQLWPNAFMCLL